MRKLVPLLLPALLLGGCALLVPRTTSPAGGSYGRGTADGGYMPPRGGYDTPPPSASAAPIPEADGVTATYAPANVQGSWRVSTINGKAIELPNPVTIAIDPAAIKVQSGCIAMAWHYTFMRGALNTSQAPIVSCRRGYLPQEQTLFEALSSNVQVRQTVQNGMEMIGNGHRIVLFRQ